VAILITYGLADFEFVGHGARTYGRPDQMANQSEPPLR